MGFISELCMCCQWQLNVCFSFHVDRAIRHRACSLRDMAQALLKAELDPEFERLCHEITQSRKLRGECLCQHVHSPENPGLPVFVATWTVQKTQRWVSLLPLTPSRELGGECLCRHVHSREFRGVFVAMCTPENSGVSVFVAMCAPENSGVSVFVAMCTPENSGVSVFVAMCTPENSGVSVFVAMCTPENSGVSVFVAMCTVQIIQGCLWIWWHVHSPENWGVGVFVTGFAWSLKVFESLRKMGKAFQGLESLWKLSGVCASLWICGFQSAREKLSIYHKVCFPRPNSSLKNCLWILKGLFVWDVVLRSFIAHFILYMKQILRQKGGKE